MINQKLIDTVLRVAKELATPETLEEVNAIGHSIGRMYDEAELAAEIAVKMALRIIGVNMETRAITPVDVIVTQGIEIHRERYSQ